MSQKLRLSNTKVTTFLKCRIKYKWTYIENLVLKGRAWAPSVGIVVHHILFLNNKGLLQSTPMEDLWTWVGKSFPELEEDKQRELVTEAAGLVTGYLQTLEGNEIKVVSPEVALEKDFGSYILYARLDGICQTPDGRKWRLEYKTTAKTDSVYLKGLRRGLQTGICHFLADELLEEKLSGTVFSLLVKTKIPQYPWMPYVKERWVMDYARQCCEGVARSIEHNDLYPSLDCQYGNFDCDYKPLCSSGGSEQVKQAFYKRREVIPEQDEQKLSETDKGSD